MFVPKGGGTLAIFMYYWIDSEKIFMHYWLINLWAVFYASIHTIGTLRTLWGLGLPNQIGITESINTGYLKLGNLSLHTINS